MSNSLPNSQINIRRNVISAPLTEARDAYQLAKMRDPSIGTLDEWIAAQKGERGPGYYAFTQDQAGHLILSYEGDTAPEFFVNEHGHLIITI